jgi:hypothetical protein
MRFKKRHMKRQFGATDMAHLAAVLYECYHGKLDVVADYGADLYEVCEGDNVQHSFLRMAYYLVDLAEVDAERGLGTAYYR